MRCENCGAPLGASATNKAQVCAYCGSAEEPKPKANSVGALVDELLQQVRIRADAHEVGTDSKVLFVQQTSLTVDGRRCESVEELPPLLRQAVSHGLAVADGMGRQGKTDAPSTITVASEAFVEDARRVPTSNAGARVVVGLIVLLAMFVLTLAVVLLAG